MKLAGSGTAATVEVGVNDGVIIKVAVPVAPADTVISPSTVNEETPPNMAFTLEPPRFAVASVVSVASLPNKKLAVPVTDPLDDNLAEASVMLKPAGAVNVKLANWPAVIPAKSLSGMVMLRPPFAVLGPMLMPLATEDETVVVKFETKFVTPVVPTETEHPAEPKPTKLVRSSVLQLLARAIAVAVSRTSVTKKSFRVRSHL